MAADKRKELALRLRNLADKLSPSSPRTSAKPGPKTGARPGAKLGARPGAKLSEAGKVLDELERLLVPTPEPPLQMPMDLSETTPGAVAGAAAGGPIRIWSDGSCAPNPGVGGWGAILERDGAREELSGASPNSTNNVMEMTGAIEALRRTPPGAEVEVVTDSQYVKNGITQWVRGWKRRGWRKANGDPVLNRELWEALDELVATRRVKWLWTRGHSGHPENERCDELANQARRAIS